LSERGGLARPVFDPVEWEAVKRAVTAVFRGDTEAMFSELAWIYETVGDSSRASVYLHYALRCQALRRIKKRPNTADLKALAAQGQDFYGRYTTREAASLREVLETVWDLREPHPDTTGTRFQLAGSIALAAIIDTPADLDVLEVALKEWLATHEMKFAEVFRQTAAGTWRGIGK
jgi:hypothetical protein